jgi:hypothetical protein
VDLIVIGVSSPNSFDFINRLDDTAFHLLSRGL